MPRPYGTWSDEQLRRERELREAQIEQGKAAQEAHDKTEPRGNDLAHSHMALVISREVAALSKDLVSIHVEQSLREQGEWKQLPV